MKRIGSARRATGLSAALAAPLILVACDPGNRANTSSAQAPATDAQTPPASLEMGGAKSVTRFFVTSRGSGRGGDLGGLAGADAHCQSLATAEGAGDHTWRAYLSTAGTATDPPVHARDRIGRGPWYNAEGELVAADVEQLHGPDTLINKQTAVTERVDPVNGVGDEPNRHDILTGSRPDGTALTGTGDRTCGNWTSSGPGQAQVGHHDRMGQGEGSSSWNSAHASRGCSQVDLGSTGGAGLFYCFAVE